MNETPMERLSVGRGHPSAACATPGRCRCQLRRQAPAIIQASPPLAAAGAAAAARSCILLHLHRVCRAQVGPLLGSRQQHVLAGCGAGLWVGGWEGGARASEARMVARCTSPGKHTPIVHAPAASRCALSATLAQQLQTALPLQLQTASTTRGCLFASKSAPESKYE